MRPSKILESSLSFLYQFVRKSFWVYLNLYHNVGIFYLSSPAVPLKTSSLHPDLPRHILGWPLCPQSFLFSLKSRQSLLSWVLSLPCVPLQWLPSYRNLPRVFCLWFLDSYLQSLPASWIIFSATHYLSFLYVSSLWHLHPFTQNTVHPDIPVALSSSYMSLYKNSYSGTTPIQHSSLPPSFLVLFFSYRLSPNPRKT